MILSSAESKNPRHSGGQKNGCCTRHCNGFFRSHPWINAWGSGIALGFVRRLTVKNTLFFLVPPMRQQAPIIPHIIDQHAEEAAFFWLLRSNAVSAPHYDLQDLAKLDERVEAHLDGLRIAGDHGWEVSLENMQAREPGEVFTAAVLALEGTAIERINQVYAAVAECPETVDGLVSALGWVDSKLLQGKVNGLLNSGSPFWRRVGIAACAAHRVDPGRYLQQAIADDDLPLRCRALRTAGELGRVDLLPAILQQLHQEDAAIRFWAAWTAVLRGNHGAAMDALQAVVLQVPVMRKEPCRSSCGC